MTYLHARLFARNLFFILMCFSSGESLLAQDESAVLSTQIDKIQAQLNACCEQVDAQGELIETCCAELKESINRLEAQLQCSTSDCCSVSLFSTMNLPQGVQTADWSFDGKYVAIGLDASYKGKRDTKTLKIYELVGTNLVFRGHTAIGKALNSVTCVRWHPSKYRLAVGRENVDDSDEDHLYIFDFIPSNGTLIEKDSTEFVNVFAVAWRNESLNGSSSDEEDALAVGREACHGKFELALYGVSAAGTLSDPSPKLGINTHGKISKRALDWDVTSQYLAVGVEATNNNKTLQVYEFNTKKCCLELNSCADGERFPGDGHSKSTVLSVSWNPECKNLLMVGLKGNNGQLAQVFEHCTNKLCLRCGIGDLNKSVYSVDWKNCSCLALGRSSNNNVMGEFRTYQFDKESCTFTLSDNFSSGNHDSVNEVRWSPNKSYVLNASDAPCLNVYKAECKKNSFCDLVGKVDGLQSKIAKVLNCCSNNDSSCQNLDAKLDCVNSVLCGKLKELECIILDCCTHKEQPIDCCESLFERLESIIDHLDCTAICDISTIISKLDDIDSKISICCSKQDFVDIPDCCSTVDVIDQRTQTILSKVCLIETDVENGFFSVCSKLEEIMTDLDVSCTIINNITNNITNITTDTLIIECNGAISAIEQCCFTLNSRIDLINIPTIPDCCSTVDIIDQRTETILSKVCNIDMELYDCCFTLNSKIDLINTSTIPDCCSVVDAIDQRTEAILSKVCLLLAASKQDFIDIPDCCSTVDVIDQRTQTILSKVCLLLAASKQDFIDIPDCCSTVDVIDQRTQTILSKLDTIEQCCSNVEEMITINISALRSCCDDLNSKIDIGIPNCCSVVDAIDQRTETILSKVCNIDTELYDCCFTLNSKIDLIDASTNPDCCSVVDVIDQRTETILSKVCLLLAASKQDFIDIPDCCSTVDVIDQRTQTILSKVCLLLAASKQDFIDIPDCCSTVDVIDQRTQTILSKVCLLLAASKQDFIDIPDCCSTVDVIDQRTQTILSKVCLLLAASKQDFIDIPDCCSTVDAIDQRTQTILSKVCTIDACCLSLYSKIDNLPICCSILDEIPQILSKVCLIQSTLETCCASLNENLVSCCCALQNQLETCCDELLEIDECILEKVSDIHKCVIDFDKCDEMVCLKDRVKAILKKVCKIEEDIANFSLSDSISLSSHCDESIFAKISCIDQKIDDIDKKLDCVCNASSSNSSWSSSSSRAKAITSGTSISSAGTYYLNTNMQSQSIKIDLGSAASVVLDLNGYIVEDIKIISDKAGTIKNLIIRNGKVINTISTDGKNVCSNIALRLEHVSVQNLNLSKINNMSLTVDGFIDSLNLSGADILANLSSSVIRTINIDENAKDISVQNARVIENIRISQHARNIMLNAIDVCADGGAGDISIDSGHNVCMHKVTARSITFGNGCTDCIVRQTKCTGGGLKISESENINCIDCMSTNNSNGAGFSSISSVASVFDNCIASENEDGFMLLNDSYSSIVHSHAKRNKKAGVKDKDCIGCSINDSKSFGNGSHGFQHTGSTQKSQSNPTIHNLNYAAGNSINYSQLATSSARVRLNTDEKSYGDNVAARLP